MKYITCPTEFQRLKRRRDQCEWEKEKLKRRVNQAYYKHVQDKYGCEWNGNEHFDKDGNWKKPDINDIYSRKYHQLCTVETETVLKMADIRQNHPCLAMCDFLREEARYIDKNLKPWTITHKHVIDMCQCKNKSCVWDIIQSNGLEDEYPLPEGINHRNGIGYYDDCNLRRDVYDGERTLLKDWIVAVTPQPGETAAKEPIEHEEPPISKEPYITMKTYDNAKMLKWVFNTNQEAHDTLNKLESKLNNIKSQKEQAKRDTPFYKEKLRAYNDVQHALRAVDQLFKLFLEDFTFMSVEEYVRSQTITFFKSRYNMHTNFAMEAIEQTVDFGCRVNPTYTQRERDEMAAQKYKENHDIVLIEILERILLSSRTWNKGKLMSLLRKKSKSLRKLGQRILKDCSFYVNALMDEIIGDKVLFTTWKYHKKILSEVGKSSSKYGDVRYFVMNIELPPINC